MSTLPLLCSVFPTSLTPETLYVCQHYPYFVGPAPYVDEDVNVVAGGGGGGGGGGSCGGGGGGAGGASAAPPPNVGWQYFFLRTLPGSRGSSAEGADRSATGDLVARSNAVLYLAMSIR